MRYSKGQTRARPSQGGKFAAPVVPERRPQSEADRYLPSDPALVQAAVAFLAEKPSAPAPSTETVRFEDLAIGERFTMNREHAKCVRRKIDNTSWFNESDGTTYSTFAVGNIFSEYGVRRVS